MSKQEIKSVVAEAIRLAKQSAESADQDPAAKAAIASTAEQIKKLAGSDPAIASLLDEVGKLMQPDGAQTQPPA